MKIIKKGKTPTNTKKFKCRQCGTKFEAESGEYRTDFDPREHENLYTCNCPVCNWLCAITE